VRIERFIGAFIADWTETQWALVHTTAIGDRVIAERVDRTKVGRREVELLCVGVFEMAGGKIAVWRDYFDLLTYVRGIGPRAAVRMAVRQLRGSRGSGRTA
jgi:limonene-1,2-epoxide hydrolase